MKVNVSGPNSINYMKLMDMAQSVLNTPDIMISDMRFGPANGIAGYLTNTEGENIYKWYLFTTKGQINIDIQENVTETKEDSEDGQTVVE